VEVPMVAASATGDAVGDDIHPRIGPFTDSIANTGPYAGPMAAGSVTLFGMLAATSLAAAVLARHGQWSYSGENGPAHWGSVSAPLCGAGKFQSPIDIDPAEVRARSLPPLVFDYSPGSARVIDNGHTVEVKVATGNVLRVGTARYALIQFHFHRPSEERIGGVSFEMSAHFVHRDRAGHVAVVGVLIMKGPPNPLFERIERRLSGTAPRHPAQTDWINPLELLPARPDYYAYRGSLTTPPCSEGVRWFVLKTPVTLSEEQIASFARLYPNNARPVQPLNGRVLLMTR
jgi:carbonic anhydrase